MKDRDNLWIGGGTKDEFEGFSESPGEGETSARDIVWRKDDKQSRKSDPSSRERGYCSRNELVESGAGGGDDAVNSEGASGQTVSVSSWSSWPSWSGRGWQQL